MGRDFINWSEIPDDLKCPKCGSRIFRISGAFKAEYETLAHIDERGLVVDQEKEFGEEWRIVWGISCDKCGYDLSDLVGL